MNLDELEKAIRVQMRQHCSYVPMPHQDLRKLIAVARAAESLEPERIVEAFSTRGSASNKWSRLRDALKALKEEA